jgi:Phage integrase, N-terminal SAM-like domain
MAREHQRAARHLKPGPRERPSTVKPGLTPNARGAARRNRIPFCWIGGSYLFTVEYVAAIVRLYEMHPVGDADRQVVYWRARYGCLPVKRALSARRAGGDPYRTRREAERAANDAETQARRARFDPSAGCIRFGNYATCWYATQDLAASTMQNYRRHIEQHLLPTFENVAVSDIRRRTLPTGKAGARRRLRRVEHQHVARDIAPGPGGCCAGSLREANPAAR